MRIKQSVLICFGMALVLMTVGTASAAEMPVMVWDETFGDVGWDTADSVQQTSDGGYIVAGQIHNDGNYDMWLIKTNSAGSEDWNVTFDGGSNDGAYSVQQTTDGGYIVAGYTHNADDDFWLVKTNNAGSELWNATFDSNSYNSDYAYSVQQTTDGGYIVTGDFSGACLLKINSSGNEVWNQTFSGMT